MGEAMETDPLIGEVVASRYRVLKKMGEGGMGTVYLAEHVTIEKKVALKVLHAEYSRKEDLKERFLLEAKAASRINHENIIDITDFGETDSGSVFFAMEHLEGRDLSEVIKQDGPMAWSRARAVLLQICRALGAAHSKEIIHRDMKPENIFLIEREGRPDFVKVLDFGIAKVEDERQSRLTRTGMIFGTPEYMSPEQAQGHHPDHRIDVYAVGVIMYELLTGEVPFKADTFMGVLTKHIFEQPMAPRELKPDLAIPVEAEAITLKGMAKDREERFNSMTEMAAAIQQVSGRMTHSTSDLPPVRLTASSDALKGKPSGPRTISGAPGGRHVAEPVDTIPPEISGQRGKLALVAVLLLLLLGGAVAAVLLLREGGPPIPTPKVAANLPAKKVAPRVEAPPKKPVVKYTKLKVRSEPKGAVVFLGDQEIGPTPQTLKLPMGDTSVALRFKLKGFKTLEKSIVPTQSEMALEVKLEKIAVARRTRRRRVRWPPVPSRKPALAVKPKKPKKPKKPRKPRQTTGAVDKDDIRDPFK